MLNLPQTGDGTPNGHGAGRAQAVCASGDDLLAALAFPDPDDCPLDGVLPAEGAAVGGVLGDLDLAQELAERGAVSGAIFSGDSHFSRAVLTHFGLIFIFLGAFV